MTIVSSRYSLIENQLFKNHIYFIIYSLQYRFIEQISVLINLENIILDFTLQFTLLNDNLFDFIVHFLFNISIQHQVCTLFAFSYLVRLYASRLAFSVRTSFDYFQMYELKTFFLNSKVAENPMGKQYGAMFESFLSIFYKFELKNYPDRKFNKILSFFLFRVVK